VITAANHEIDLVVERMADTGAHVIGELQVTPAARGVGRIGLDPMAGKPDPAAEEKFGIFKIGEFEVDPQIGEPRMSFDVPQIIDGQGFGRRVEAIGLMGSNLLIFDLAAQAHRAVQIDQIVDAKQE
jgi:hypothetical protein